MPTTKSSRPIFNSGWMPSSALSTTAPATTTTTTTTMAPAAGLRGWRTRRRHWTTRLPSSLRTLSVPWSAPWLLIPHPLRRPLVSYGGGMEKHDVACSALLLHPIRLQLQRPIPFQRPLPPCTSVPSPITRIPMHHTSRGLTYGGAMTRAALSRGSCVRSALSGCFTSRRSGSGGQPAQPLVAEAEKVRHETLRCVKLLDFESACTARS